MDTNNTIVCPNSGSKCYWRFWSSIHPYTMGWLFLCNINHGLFKIWLGNHGYIQTKVGGDSCTKSDISPQGIMYFQTFVYFEYFPLNSDLQTWRNVLKNCIITNCPVNCLSLVSWLNWFCWHGIFSSCNVLILFASL